VRCKSSSKMEGSFVWRRVRQGGRHAAVCLTLVGTSLAILFVVGEILCRLFFPDTRLRYVNDPEALYRLAPNQVATIELASGVLAPPARINELGLRGADPGPIGPRILVLGDSFAFGSGVGDDETFAARLNQWFDGAVSVVNGGQPGYGIFQMAAALRRLGGDLRPRLVIVVLWQGDFLRQPPDATERARFIRRQQLSQIVKTSVLGTHLYRRLERLLAEAGQESLVFRVGEGGKQGQASARAIRESHLRGMRADAARLLAMHEAARRYGTGLLLVLWPKEDFANLPETERGLAHDLTVGLEAFARRHSIPFISVQSAMRRVASKARLLIPHDWHPTPFAHCLAAERIAQELKELDFPLFRSASCGAEVIGLPPCCEGDWSPPTTVLLPYRHGSRRCRPSCAPLDLEGRPNTLPGVRAPRGIENVRHRQEPRASPVPKPLQPGAIQ
jgi:hypothetical protein